MQSASKVSLDKATLARWSEKYLGRTIMNSREITDGWFNTIHVLEMADGSKCVLKVSPPPAFACMRYERDIITAEVAVLRHLSREGIHVPRVLADCPDGDGLGHPWFIMAFMEGESWEKLRKNQPPERCGPVDAAIGRQAALVNRIRGERFGRWNEDHCGSTSWTRSFLCMVDDLLADARDKAVQLPLPEDRLRGIFEAGREDLDLVKEPRLVLYDLHDGNVLV
jgi:aminoglycoside phosphotransferase (APT) family kinase protein